MHEVLAAVLQVRDQQLQVLLWQRAIEPDAGRWALPGGRLSDSEDVQTSVLRQLAEKVDVRDVAHVEQLEVFSAPDRMPH
ncbi:MAG: NUDIX domain-containing protein, partial [Pseudonocardiaceae bacterium]